MTIDSNTPILTTKEIATNTFNAVAITTLYVVGLVLLVCLFFAIVSGVPYLVGFMFWGSEIGFMLSMIGTILGSVLFFKKLVRI